jgi:hypothetical protein
VGVGRARAAGLASFSGSLCWVPVGSFSSGWLWTDVAHVRAGVDGFAADKGHLVVFKEFLEKILEGVPGLSILCTSMGPLGVPYENIIGVTRLSDSEIAGLVRRQGYSEFTSGTRVVKYINGNPMLARFCSALLLEGRTPDEIHDIISSHHGEDRKKLKIGQLDPDPWNDPIKVYVTKEGLVLGNNLCVRAWLMCVLGHLYTYSPGAYVACYFLSCAPAGLEYRDFVSMVHGHEDVLDCIFTHHALVEVVDVSGNKLQSISDRKSYYKEKGGLGLLRLLPSLRRAMQQHASEDGFPPEAVRMLRPMLAGLDKAGDIIHENLLQFKTKTAMQDLLLCQSNMLAAIDYDHMIRPDRAGAEMAMVEQCGRVALYVALIMLALGRLAEAVDATVACAKFFGRVFEQELDPKEIRSRQVCWSS